ncbi:DUF4167 domain-containing protein [Beijerinckia indica]|nr:DUF4167 domain-containing protein [Beijerinckia indica]
MRGRPNNRKGPNPLTRSYESNGPDVKIRGTAHHIGEKYLQLARDAQSAGDPVMAESYLQHAEHYFRLIAAAQQAQQQAANGYQRAAGESDVEETEEDEDDFGGVPDRFASPLERFPAATSGGSNAQPYADRSFYSNNGGDRPNYERPERSQRQETRQERSYQDRSFQERSHQERPHQERQERSYQERSSYQERRERNNEERGQQEHQQPREQTHRSRGRGNRDYHGEGQSRGERFSQREDTRQPATEPLDTQGALPAFITAPVRLQPSQETRNQEPRHQDPGLDTLPGIVSNTSESNNEEVTGFHLRPRRRRRTKAEMAVEQGFSNDTANATDPVGD